MSDFKNIGSGLMKHAEKTPVSARGIIEELFPYIYVASKRMSTRAISEWLEKEHNVQLSHVTISKALKNSEEHFERIVDQIYEAAETFEIYCNYDSKICCTSKLNFLFSEGRFNQIQNDMVINLGRSMNAGAVMHVVQKIEKEWFVLPLEVREQCEPIIIRRNTKQYDTEKKAEFVQHLIDEGHDISMIPLPLDIRKFIKRKESDQC